MSDIIFDEMNSRIIETRLLREKIQNDTSRPGYHFVCPVDLGIPFDPNCIFFANGRYHLMYLYECRSDSCRMGHASSIDMVHWHFHKEILTPDDLDSCIFSGGVYLDDDGTAYIAYMTLPKEGVGKGKGGIRLAMSKDIKNHYETWEKYPEFLIESTDTGVIEENGEIHCAADPSNIWKKDGYYYMTTGNLMVVLEHQNEESPKELRGDRVDLYRSADMYHWEYVNRFYDRRTDNSWTAENEDDMCPCFFPLPKGKDTGVVSDKYIQLFISHCRGQQYYIGIYDKDNDKFLPEAHGRMTWVDNAYFAPEAFIAPDGRLIVWTWLQNNRYEISDRKKEELFGWSGIYGLPRYLWLNDDNTLGMAPIKEINILRYNQSDSIEKLNGISCEIHAVFNGEGGFKLRCSPDGSEYTLVYYDSDTHELVFDATKSGTLGRCVVERAPFKLKESEKLDLTVYIDHCVIELYANDRQAICRCVYPDGKDSTIIEYYKNKPESIECWEIMPSNEI